MAVGVGCVRVVARPMEAARRHGITRRRRQRETHFGWAIDARQIASSSQPASKDGFKPVGRCVSSHAAEFEVPWGRSPSRSSCNRYAGNHCSSTAAIGRPVELIGRAGNQRLRSLFIGAASGANFVEPVSRCPARRTASRATANPPGATSAR